MPTAVSFGRDREGVFHPAAFIDVVDQEVAEESAAGPQERVELANLVGQVAHPGGGRPHERIVIAGVHAVGPQQNQVADLPVLDPLPKLVPALRCGGT